MTDMFASVPLFRDLPKKAQERLERIAHERTFKEGTVIMKEGDEGVGFFLIKKGTVEITRAGTSLATLGEGDFFGEMALVDHHRRSATVTAKETTDCVGMLRSDFIAELRSNPDLAIDMLAAVSGRLRELDEKFSR